MRRWRQPMMHGGAIGPDLVRKGGEVLADVDSREASGRRREIAGACMVSAAGSLPLHVASFMVALAAAEGRLPIDQAGWISSCLFAGILVSAVCLALCGLTRVTASWVAVSVIVVLVALYAGTTQGRMYLLGGWLVVGLSCGVLHFLGSTSAASYVDRHFVLGLRLALVLYAAAAVIGGAALIGGFRSYAVAATVLGIGFAAACLVGLIWYRPPPIVIASSSKLSGVPSIRGERWHGLAITVLFFAGQPGFMAYAAHIAVSNGVSVAGLPVVWACCKGLGATALLKWGAHTRSGPPTFKLGLMLAVAVLAMTFAHNLAAFAVGLLLWEVAINVQSIRLQATVVTLHPWHAGPWLPAAIATGAGIGPVIHGALIGHATGHLFVAYSVLSGLLPAVWILRRASARVVPGPSS